MAWPTKTTFVDGDVLTAAEVNNIGTNLNVFNPTSATNGQVWVANGAGSGAYGAAGFGAVMTPTSVTASSGTATINANGSVTLTTVPDFSLNGVFTSAYVNYLVFLQTTTTVAATQSVNLRAAGVNSTSNYNHQYLLANGATISGARTTSAAAWDNCAWFGTAGRNLSQMLIFSPQIAQATAMRSVTSGSYNSSAIMDSAAYHTTASSYDGFFWTVGGGGTFTGKIIVYGLVS